MEQDGVTEQRAYSALRSKNKASRKPMHAVAETVLEMDQIT
jgi:AmiR/NasT family two-component response regulator